MTAVDPLDIEYESHDRVREMIDVVRYCLESVSLSFDRWGEPRVKGPGLYLAIVTGRSLKHYADPMGDNRWPVDECRVILDDLDCFYRTLEDVSMSRDGAVVVSVDGTVQEQMVRFHDHSSFDPDHGAEVEYADWMGSRHMSAADTSLRPEVVTTLTLSAEDGRVTVFKNGAYEARARNELLDVWRAIG